MLLRRSVLPGILGAAALLPALAWLRPALLARMAPSFRDQGDFFFPLKLYTADRIGSGQLPLWNPLSGLGEPWLANGQSGVFYPPTSFFLLPFPALAAGLFLLLHFAIGVAGAWRFAREETVSDAGALIAAGAFGACGFAASLSVYWNHFGAWAYLPWIAALARSGLRTRGSRIALSAAIGLQAMAGSPEMCAASLVLAALFSWEARPEQSGWLDPPPWRRLLRFAGAAALGLALAGWTLVPMAELAMSSDRRAALPVSERDRGAAGLFAVSSALGLSPGASGTEYLSTLYAGPLLLFGAAAAFAEKERRRLAILLGSIALAGVLVAMAGVPGSWLRALPVLDRVRYPAKALALTFFSLAMLAGLGADALRFDRSRKRAVFLVAAGLAGLAMLLFSGQPPLARVAEGVGLAALILLALPAAAGAAAPGVGRGAALEMAAAAGLLVGLFFAGSAVFRFAPESEIRRVAPSVPFLSRIAGRVLTPPEGQLVPWVLRDARFDAATLRRQRESLLGYTNLLSGVPTVRTAAALPTLGERRIVSSIDEGDPVLAGGAAGARLLWTPFLPPDLGSHKVGDFFRAPINPYRSRLSFVTSYRVEPDGARAWERAAKGEIDWAREVFLNREPDPRPAPAARRSFVVAWLVEDSAERVAADVNSNAPGILVLADLHYPGWTAQVDGRPAPILFADGYLRAVALSAGPHRVLFRYRPIAFYAGAAISVAALLALAALLLFGPAVPARGSAA